jgi:hypothetical protein
MKISRIIAGLLLAVAVVAPAAAHAATPLAGVPTEIRRGFYTEMDMGTFFTLGGKGKSPSDPQAYVSLGAGYDVFATQQHFISLGLSFSMGTSAGGCYGTMSPDGRCLGQGVDPNDPSKPLELSDNWSLTTFEGSALYGYFVGERLMLTARLLGGLGIVEPDAFEDGGELMTGPLPLVGGGLGLEWATQFDHFSLGLDAAAKMLIGPNALGISIAPRVKYTF